jgi:hypothetical protein
LSGSSPSQLRKKATVPLSCKNAPSWLHNHTAFSIGLPFAGVIGCLSARHCKPGIQYGVTVTRVILLPQPSGIRKSMIDQGQELRQLGQGGQEEGLIVTSVLSTCWLLGPLPIAISRGSWSACARFCLQPTPWWAAGFVMQAGVMGVA